MSTDFGPSMASAADRLVEWRRLAEDGLPSEANFVARNRAITARYARLYLDRPAELKWAGLAAFASNNVGLALKGRYLPVAEIQDDLEALRAGNNAIQRDIAWAHLAYAARGAAEVRACLEALVAEPGGADVGLDRVATAFDAIEAGLDGGRSDEVWRGNETLLAHEQLTTVQPYFERIDDDFAVFLSLGTSLDLDDNPIRIDFRTVSSFPLSMLTRLGGLRILLQTRSLPDIRIPEHRWFWARRSLLPRWRQVEESREALPHLERMASA